MPAPSLHRQLVILLILTACVFGAYREWSVRPDGSTHVFVLDVGQGDSMFIRGPHNEQIIIDGGPDLSALAGIGRHMSMFDRSIDLFVLSHPDLDHVFSFPDILKRYRVKAVLMTGVAAGNVRAEEAYAYLKEKKIPVIIADPTKDIVFESGLTLDILWPPPIYAGQKPPIGANNTSIVLKLIYGKDSMLFTGDMEEIEEMMTLIGGANIDSDILKVGHHGSKTSSSTGFLLAASPDSALISAGRDNKFGHPHKVITDRLTHFGIPYRVTAKEGTIEVVMDGE